MLMFYKKFRKECLAGVLKIFCIELINSVFALDIYDLMGNIKIEDK